MFFLLAVGLSEPFAARFGQIFDDRMRFIQCATVVRAIERQVMSGKAKDEIVEAIQNHCSRLVDSHKEVCDQILTTSMDKVITHVRDGRRVDFVCDILGFSHGFGQERLIPKDTCIQVIDALKAERPQLLEDTATEKTEETKTETSEKPSGPLNPSSPAQIPFGLGPTRNTLRQMPFLRRPAPSVCRKMKSNEERARCQIVARVATRELSDEIAKGENSEKICQMLQDRKLIKLTEPTPESEQQPKATAEPEKVEK